MRAAADASGLHARAAAPILVPCALPMVRPPSAFITSAMQQPQDMQDGLFLATDNDVVAYLDLIEG